MERPCSSPEQSPAESAKLKNHLKKLNRKLAENHLPKDFTCFMAYTTCTGVKDRQTPMLTPNVAVSQTHSSPLQGLDSKMLYNRPRDSP